MAFKILLVVSAAIACAYGGIIGAPATFAPGPQVAAAPLSFGYGAQLVSPYSLQTGAITSQSANTLRSFGNLGQVSTYSKTIDTPFSSVRKADVRVSNPGLRVAAAYPAAAYAAPAIAAPAALGVAYSAAPAVSHVEFHGLANYGW